jgi:hypothetical protein
MQPYGGPWTPSAGRRCWTFMVGVGEDGIHVLHLKAADALGNEFQNNTPWQ